MRIVTFFRDKLSLLRGGVSKNSQSICWVLATLILSFSFYVYQEVSFATERLGHSIEKASLIHDLRGADNHINQQDQAVFFMDRVIKEQNSMLIEQDLMIRELLNKLKELLDKKRDRGLEI